MEKEKYSRLQLVNSLTKIGHGKFDEYKKIGIPAVQSDPFLFAHLIAWNQRNSKIKDTKTAYPVIGLRGDPEYAENAIAHMMLQGPRELYKAYLFSKELTKEGLKIKGCKRSLMQWAIQQYLNVRQGDKKWFDTCVLQNRKSMKGLYAVSHMKPSAYAQAILFDRKYPKGSVFDVVKNMKNMAPKEAAGHIINSKIPLTVAIGAAPTIKNDDVVLALLEGISGNELLNNTKTFEDLGVMDKPALKAAYENAVERAKKDKRVNVYKASVTKTKVSKKTAEKLVSVQKEQEKKQKELKGIDGDWLIHGDMSASMDRAIEEAKKVAALIASQTKGKVHLIFADTYPTYFDVTGMDFEQIKNKTKGIRTRGATSLGVGIDYLLQGKIPVEGMVIVSDGGENSSPRFDPTYRRYCLWLGIEPSVYHLWLPGDYNQIQYDYIQYMNISVNFDEYAFSNLTNLLRANKYQLIDDVINTPLLTFNKVFKKGVNYDNSYPKQFATD